MPEKIPRRQLITELLKVLGLASAFYSQIGCKQHQEPENSKIQNENRSHLFRINFTYPNINEPDEISLAERLRSFRETDEAVSSYFNVHVLNIPMSELRKNHRGILSMYGRDLITEWGEVLYVSPALLDGLLSRFSIFQNSPLRSMMDRMGYDKKIIPMEVASEGGLHIIGREFILLSDLYLPSRRSFEKIARNGGLDVPLYFFPSLTSTSGGHIDCDYQIIDSLKLIYGDHNVFNGLGDDFKGARRKLEDIAKRHNYDLREYKSYSDEKQIDASTDDFMYEMARQSNGINFLLNGKVLLTSNIHPEEKKFLQKRGLEAVLIPLGKVSPGAGLRCVYGQFSL